MSRTECIQRWLRIPSHGDGLPAFFVLLLTGLGFIVLFADFSSDFARGPTWLAAWGAMTAASVLVFACAAGRRLRIALLVGLVVAYVGSYIGFSAQGGYGYETSGKLRGVLVPGFAFPDQSMWNPALMRWKPFLTFAGEHTYFANDLGWFYSPLIIADRRWFHPTEQLITPEDVALRR